MPKKTGREKYKGISPNLFTTAAEIAGAVATVHPPTERRKYRPRDEYSTDLRSDAWLPEWRAFIEALGGIHKTAEALGVSTITLRRWGTGRAEIRYQGRLLVFAVARAKGVTPPVSVEEGPTRVVQKPDAAMAKAWRAFISAFHDAAQVAEFVGVTTQRVHAWTMGEKPDAGEQTVIRALARSRNVPPPV